MKLTHIANPVHVKAQEIVNVIGATLTSNGGIVAVVLDDDGTPFETIFSPGMIARYEPVSGDYLVTQEDGYQYINPKAVFERKYRVIGDEPAAAPRDPFADRRRDLRSHFLTLLLNHRPGSNLCKSADEFVEYVMTGKYPART